MSYFLYPTPLKIGEILELSGDEAKHILLSRRIEIGEKIELQGPDKKRFLVEVINIDKKSLSVQTIQELEIPEESKLKITIFQALIKEQPLDFIIQKATELGVSKLYLFNSKNSSDRFKEMGKKLPRWRKISEEATKQSGRVMPIEIEFLESDNNLNKLFTGQDFTFLLEPTSTKKFSTWVPGSQITNVGILVGPEGRFTGDEIREFSKIKNIVPISLGPRILRADTAAIISSGIVQSVWGDL